MTVTTETHKHQPPGRRETKRQVLSLLAQPDLAGILAEIATFPDRDLIGPLFSALCHADEVVRWHAVSVFGRTVSRMAHRDMESARIVMRRILWSLNDESGGIGWGAPEAMAEVMFHSQALAGEYLHMLVSYMREDGPEAFQDGNFIELPMLQRGVLWGVGRLIPRYRVTLAEMAIEADLRSYLRSPDGDVRGLACRCLELLGANCPAGEAANLARDGHQLRVYSEDGWLSCTVAAIARRLQVDGIATGPAGDDRRACQCPDIQEEQ